MLPSPPPPPPPSGLPPPGPASSAQARSARDGITLRIVRMDHLPTDGGRITGTGGTMDERPLSRGSLSTTILALALAACGDATSPPDAGERDLATSAAADLTGAPPADLAGGDGVAA